MRLAKALYFFFAALVGLLLSAQAVRLFSPDFSSGFLLDKEAVFPVYKYFLYSHIVAAPVALLAGLLQFTAPRMAAHRWLGRLYVVSILVFAAPGGGYMAFYAFGGRLSVLSFLLMSGLWAAFTWLAYRKALAGDLQAHTRYMTRSFILTNSAVVLRVLLFINNHWHLMEPEAWYVLSTWLSWAPALLVYEGLRRRRLVVG